jgi:hypothetical protein
MHLKRTRIAHNRFPTTDADPLDQPVTSPTAYERSRHYRIFKAFFGHDV